MFFVFLAAVAFALCFQGANCDHDPSLEELYSTSAVLKYPNGTSIALYYFTPYRRSLVPKEQTLFKVHCWGRTSEYEDDVSITTVSESGVELKQLFARKHEGRCHNQEESYRSGRPGASEPEPQSPYLYCYDAETTFGHDMTAFKCTFRMKQSSEYKSVKREILVKDAVEYEPETTTQPMDPYGNQKPNRPNSVPASKGEKLFLILTLSQLMIR